MRSLLIKDETSLLPRGSRGSPQFHSRLVFRPYIIDVSRPVNSLRSLPHARILRTGIFAQSKVVPRSANFASRASHIQSADFFRARGTSRVAVSRSNEWLVYDRPALDSHLCPMIPAPGLHLRAIHVPLSSNAESIGRRSREHVAATGILSPVRRILLRITVHGTIMSLGRVVVCVTMTTCTKTKGEKRCRLYRV